jgi:hypothetical protein
MHKGLGIAGLRKSGKKPYLLSCARRISHDAPDGYVVPNSCGRRDSTSYFFPASTEGHHRSGPIPLRDRLEMPISELTLCRLRTQENSALLRETAI